MQKIKIRHRNHWHYLQLDDADYDFIKGFHWLWRNGYATTKINGRYIGMHRVVMGVVNGEDVIIDHKDGNKLNNTRENLRRCNRFENQQNRKTNKKNVYPKGIRQLKSGRWNVRLQTNNERILLGTFDTLEEAIEERNRVAKHLHGEFFRPSHPIKNKSKSVSESC